MRQRTTQKRDALQTTGTRNPQTGTRNPKQEPVLLTVFAGEKFHQRCRSTKAASEHVGRFKSLLNEACDNRR